MTVRSRMVLLLLLAAVAAVGPATTFAQQPEQPPSELWSEFPLNPGAGTVQSPEGGAGEQPAPSAPQGTVRGGADADDESGFAGVSRNVWTVLAAAVAASLAASLLLVGAILARYYVLAALGAVAGAVVVVIVAPWRAGSWAGDRTHSAWESRRARGRARRERRKERRRERRDRRRRVAALLAPVGRRPNERTPRPVETAEPMTAAPRPQREAGLDPDVAPSRTVADVLREWTKEIVETSDRSTSALEGPVPEERSEICAISWWRGDAKSQFYAQAVGVDGRKYIVARSPMFHWRRPDPPTKTNGALAAHRTLVKKLREEGWEPASPTELWYGWKQLGRGDLWFEDRFRRRARDGLSAEEGDEGEEDSVGAAREIGPADREET